jgi:hypothetical protein
LVGAVRAFRIQDPDYFVLMEMPTSMMREQEFFPAMARTLRTRP